VQRGVCSRDFVLGCDFVEGSNCCEKIFWLCTIDLILEGGSSA
jgi:hypothetical protein